MKISHIEHLGIAVQSIEEALPYFTEVLGLECYATEVVEDQKVKTAFLRCGEVKLELLEPTSPESTIQKWLDKGNKGVHHVAFKTVSQRHWQNARVRRFALSTRLLARVLSS